MIILKVKESVIKLDEIMVQKKVPELELPFRLKKVQSGATIDIYWYVPSNLIYPWVCIVLCLPMAVLFLFEHFI